MMTTRTAVAVRVFLAAGDRDTRRMIATALRNDGHFVLEAKDEAALLLDLEHVFHGNEADTSASVVVADIRLPGRNVLAVLRTLQDHTWCPPFILIGGAGDPEFHREARRLGAHAVLQRPFDLHALRAQVSRFSR